MIILTRQQANNLSDNLVGIMTEIEDELLRKIAAQIARDNDISDTSKWRMRQLARMGQLDKEALRLIKSYSRIQSEVLYDTLMNAALTEIGYVDAGMREAAAKGLISGDMTIPADRTAENALKAYYKQAQSDLNMVNTVMGYQATAAYTGAINNIYYAVHKDLDTGTAKIVTGSESAIRQTIHNLSRNGIPAFVDRGGHHWSPEAYVRMDLRTTVGNTARAAQWSRCDNFGVSLISVDSHPGARPKCAPYQGRIFSRDGSSGTTTDGSGRKITYSPLSSTSYGEPDGLFGINCGHSCYPFIPGVNFQRYFPYDPEENAARYKEFQTQRALEREIRAAKRECMMLQAAGDKEGYEKAALRLRTQREKYRVYSNEHGLSLHNDRTQVYGFDRSQSMKAVWAERKAKPKSLTGGGNGGIINNNPSSFTQCQNFDELEKYLSTKYSISLNNTVKSLDFAACREALKGVENVFSEFPVLGAYIKEITTDSSGVMSCDGRSITFNPFYFGSNNSLQKLQNICQQQTSVGHWIKNSSLSSIGAHEAGHGIERILDDSNPLYIFDFQKTLAWNDCTEAKAIVSQAIKNVKATPYGKGKKKADLIKSVSGYASTTESEALAEAFADVFANGTNANPLSIEIKRLTIEQMKKYNKI